MFREPTKRQLTLETFEDRSMMAVGASVISGTLVIEGSEAANTLELSIVVGGTKE